MAKKAPKSSTAAPVSPQLTFYFRQLLCEHGQSPARAIEWLTHVLKVGGAVPKPALPEGWRLEADGDELFVVSPEGRRNAREFSLYQGRYLIAPPGLLKPVPPAPELMEKLYPPGYEPPKRVENPEPPLPTDPALVAVLDKIADALKPPVAAEAPKKADEPSDKKSRKTGKRRLLQQHRVRDAIIAEHRPHGVPGTESTEDVVQLLKDNWSWGCHKCLVDPNKVHPPTWHPVAEYLGRWSKPE